MRCNMYDTTRLTSNIFKRTLMLFLVFYILGILFIGVHIHICFLIYRVFLKILTHLFSVFEVLNVCLGTCSVHETKGFLEICLTTCMLSFARSYNRTKEKNEDIAISLLIKIQNFHAKVTEPVLKFKSCLPGTQ